MAVNSNEECQSIHSVVVLPDGGDTNMKYEPTLNISSMEVPKLIKSINSEPILQNQTKLEVDENVNNYAPCILDVDIEKGKPELTKLNEESVANLKFDDTLARSLPLQMGGKLLQLLMNHGAELPKFTSRGSSRVGTPISVSAFSMDYYLNINSLRRDSMIRLRIEGNTSDLPLSIQEE